MKTCSRCGKEKPLAEFYERSGRPGQYHSACKICHINDSTSRNNTSAAQEARRRYKAKQIGLSLEEADALREGKCEICGDPVDVLDHNHATGKFRGALCNYCNWMIGHAKDDPERLRSGAAYLEGKM